MSRPKISHEMPVKIDKLRYFLAIFVTRLLRSPAQIADFCAIFFAQNGVSVQDFVIVFYFLAVRREISGPEREIPSPGILFSGLGIFISGLV